MQAILCLSVSLSPAPPDPICSHSPSAVPIVIRATPPPSFLFLITISREERRRPRFYPGTIRVRRSVFAPPECREDDGNWREDGRSQWHDSEWTSEWTTVLARAEAVAASEQMRLVTLQRAIHNPSANELPLLRELRFVPRPAHSTLPHFETLLIHSVCETLPHSVAARLETAIFSKVSRLRDATLVLGRVGGPLHALTPTPRAALATHHGEKSCNPRC